jgi:hypothetical protein
MRSGWWVWFPRILYRDLLNTVLSRTRQGGIILMCKTVQGQLTGSTSCGECIYNSQLFQCQNIVNTHRDCSPLQWINWRRHSVTREKLSCVPWRMNATKEWRLWHGQEVRCVLCLDEWTSRTCMYMPVRASCYVARKCNVFISRTTKPQFHYAFKTARNWFVYWAT